MEQFARLGTRLYPIWNRNAVLSTYFANMVKKRRFINTFDELCKGIAIFYE
jgi:hypothetical protein